MLCQPKWAPDGKRLAFSDKDGKLYVLTMADKKVIQITSISSLLQRTTCFIWPQEQDFMDGIATKSQIFIFLPLKNVRTPSKYDRLFFHHGEHGKHY